jgi:hypothetical protein
MLTSSNTRGLAQRLSLALGAFALASCGSTASRPAVTVTVTSDGSAASAPGVAYPSATQPPSTPTGPKSVIEQDGTYLVGVDIRPGVYRTLGGSQCYWARLSSLDTSDIIDNNNSSGPQVIEILATDRAFLSSNCQSWTAEAASDLGPEPGARPATGSPPGPVYASTTGVLSCTYRVALTLRTLQSEVAICDDGYGSYTYKGLRLVDSARIDVTGAVPTATGFTVTNNGTRYDVSSGGLVIYSDGEVYTEPAVSSGP